MNKDNYDIFRHLAGRALKPNTALDLLTGLQDRERGGGGNNREKIASFAEEQLVRTTELNETRCELPGMPRSTFLMVFSPDCTRAASTHGNHNISVTDLRSGKNIKTLVGHPRTPWCIAFHPTSNQIVASGCLGGQVRIWDLSGGSEVWTTPSQSVIASLAFHPNDRVLVIATFNQVYFWDWNQPAPFTNVSTNHAKENVRYVAFDKLGHKLITGIANSPLTRWERVRAPVPVPRQERCASPYRRRITQRLVSSPASRIVTEPPPEPEEPPLDGNSVVPERELRITRCYRNLVREYELLVQRYLQLHRPPTMIDRGTDPMEPSHLNNGTQTATNNRNTDDAVAGPSGLQRESEPSTSHSSQNLITPSRMFLVGRKPPSSIRGTQTKESRKHKADSKELIKKNEKRMKRANDSSDDDDDDTGSDPRSANEDKRKLVVVLERLKSAKNDRGENSRGLSVTASRNSGELPGAQFDNVVPPGRPGGSRSHSERFNSYIRANRERIQEFRRRSEQRPGQPPSQQCNTIEPDSTINESPPQPTPASDLNLEEDHRSPFERLIDRIRQTAEEDVRSRILPIVQSIPQPDRAEILRLFESSREKVRRRFNNQVAPSVAARRGLRRQSPRASASTDNNSSSSDSEPTTTTTGGTPRPVPTTGGGTRPVPTTGGGPRPVPTTTGGGNRPVPTTGGGSRMVPRPTSPPPSPLRRVERDYHAELEQLVTSLLNNMETNVDVAAPFLDFYGPAPAQSTSARTRPNRGVSWLREAEQEIYSRRLLASDLSLDEPTEANPWEDNLDLRLHNADPRSRSDYAQNPPRCDFPSLRRHNPPPCDFPSLRRHNPRLCDFPSLRQRQNPPPCDFPSLRQRHNPPPCDFPSLRRHNPPPGDVPSSRRQNQNPPPCDVPPRRVFFHRMSAFMPTRVSYPRSRTRRPPHYGSGRSGTPRIARPGTIFLDARMVHQAAREQAAAQRENFAREHAADMRARETRETMVTRERAATARETIAREMEVARRTREVMEATRRVRESLERERRERELLENSTADGDILPPLIPIPNPESGSSTIRSLYSNIEQDLESSLVDVRNIRRLVARGRASGETAAILSSFSDRLDNIMMQSSTILAQLRNTMSRLQEGDDDPWAGIEFFDDNTLGNQPTNRNPVASDHTYPRDPWNYSFNEIHPALNSLHLTITHIQKQARLLRRQVQSIERIDRAMLEVTQLQMMRQLVMEMVRHVRTLAGEVQPTSSGQRQSRGEERRRSQPGTSSSTTSNIDLPGTSISGATPPPGGVTQPPRRSSNRKTYPPSRYVGVGLVRQQTNQPTNQNPRRAQLVRCLSRFERCISQMQLTRPGTTAPTSTTANNSNSNTGPNFFNYTQINPATLTAMTSRLERLLTEQMRIFTRAPDAPRAATTRSAVDLAEHIMSLRLHGCVLRMTRVLGNRMESNLLRNATSGQRQTDTAATQDGAARYGARHTLSLVLDGLSRYIEELGNNGISNGMRRQIHGVLAMSLLLTELLLLQVVDSVPPPSRHSLDPDREALARRIDDMCTEMLQSRMPVPSAQLTRSLRLMRLTMRLANRALDQAYVARRNAMLPRPDTDRRQLLGTINRCLRHINRSQQDQGQNQATPANVATERDLSDSVLNTMNELLARYSSTYQVMTSGGSNEAVSSTTGEGAQDNNRDTTAAAAAPSNNDNNTDDEAEDASEPGWFYYRNRNNNNNNNNNSGRQNNSNLYRTNPVNLAPRNVPSIQVNAGPVPPEPESFSQRLMSHRQIFAERVSELRSNQAARGLFRPRFLHPLYASVNPFDSDWEDAQREQMYDETDLITTVTPNHRIQAWDISDWTVPTISNTFKNVIVSECRIHNDASVDIASDGTILVTLLPSGGYLNVTNRLGVYSLRWESLGQCLYTTSFEQNAVSVSLSPLSRHLLVGFASRRVSIVPSDRWVMARVYRIEQKDVPGHKLPILRELEQSRENRINCIRWLPTSGQGLIYATNTGQLVILS